MAALTTGCRETASGFGGLHISRDALIGTWASKDLYDRGVLEFREDGTYTKTTGYEENDI